MSKFIVHFARRSLSLVALFALVLATATQAEDKLVKRVDELIAEPHFKTAHWGMLFVDLKTGDVIVVP